MLIIHHSQSLKQHFILLLNIIRDCLYCLELKSSFSILRPVGIIRRFHDNGMALCILMLQFYLVKTVLSNVSFQVVACVIFEVSHCLSSHTSHDLISHFSSKLNVHVTWKIRKLCIHDIGWLASAEYFVAVLTSIAIVFLIDLLSAFRAAKVEEFIFRVDMCHYSM